MVPVSLQASVPLEIVLDLEPFNLHKLGNFFVI